MAVLPDGQHALSASSDWALKLWNIQTGGSLSTFNFESGVTDCAITPDGCTVVAGEELGKVHFLRIENLEALPVSTTI